MPLPASDYVNRELSWLEFNQRVLDEATNPSVPLLDRLLFLTITASNLDEFFMVRVGGLQLLSNSGSTQRDLTGMTPGQQLDAVQQRTNEMMQSQYACLQQLDTHLQQHAIRRRELCDITEQDISLFDTHIRDIITPMSLTSPRKPQIDNLRIYVACRVRSNAASRKKPRLVLIPIGKTVERLFFRTEPDGQRTVILAEDLLRHFASQLFPGEVLLETAVFRATRNADIALQDEYTADLAAEMNRLLRRRTTSNVVRLEVSAGATRRMHQALSSLLETDTSRTCEVPGPIDLTGLRSICFMAISAKLRRPSWTPQQSAFVDPRASLFEQIRKQDIPVALPFESFNPVVRLVDEASTDPDVLAIKIILYRTSDRSPIVDALHRAAANGKYVTALVELKARFDEANNLRWAQRLEESGVQVIYGIRGLKTHAKICLVVRRDEHRIRRYVHFGTGNYNDSTAKLYTDVGFLTCNDDYGADASAFFNAVCGDSEPQPYHSIRMAPLSLREKVLELIENEIHNASHGVPAALDAKMNSLVDPAIIDALYRASQAGVTIRINVRGICCLRPGVNKLSENITVISIVDRFLEHSRIVRVHNGGDEQLYISSADWMPRNLDRRIELLVPVLDPRCLARFSELLDASLADTVKLFRNKPFGFLERQLFVSVAGAINTKAFALAVTSQLQLGFFTFPQPTEPHFFASGRTLSG